MSFEEYRKEIEDWLIANLENKEIIKKLLDDNVYILYKWNFSTDVAEALLMFSVKKNWTDVNL